MDEIGLEWNQAHEYRLRSDGKTLAVTIEHPPLAMAPGGVLELISEYWQKIGVKVAIKQEQRNLYLKRGVANERDLGTFQLGGNANEFKMFTTAAFLFRPPWGVLRVGVPWQTWYDTDGKRGEEPPAVIKRLFEAVGQWQIELPGSEEYLRLGKEILTINLENLYYIGTVGLVPTPVVVDNRIGNVLKSEGTWTVTYGFFKPHMPEQWYFK